MSAPSASPLLAPNSMIPDQPAWDVARLFPNQGHWTEERYLALETNAVLVIDGDQYRELGVYRPGETATSMVLPSFTASVDAVFQSGEEAL